MQVPTVEFLRWHPEQTSESPEGSPYKTWLAVSGRYENIHIIDVADEGKIHMKNALYYIEYIFNLNFLNSIF